MGWGAVIGTIAGAGMDLLGTKQSAEASKANTAAQIKWEKEKFGKETELANTAHQREIADLEAAGLNKILTVQGQGSPVPTMGSINPAMPDFSGYQAAGAKIQEGINTALDIELKRKTAENAIEKMIAEKEKTEAERDSIIDDMQPGRLKDQKIKELEEEQKLKQSQRTAEMQRAEHIAAQTAYQIIENAIRNKDLKWYEVDKIINYVIRVIPFAGMGALANKLGGKMTDKIIKNQAEKATTKAINNKEKIKDYKPENNARPLWQKYKTTKDGIVDLETGEILPFKL